MIPEPERLRKAAKRKTHQVSRFNDGRTWCGAKIERRTPLQTSPAPTCLRCQAEIKRFTDESPQFRTALV